MILFDLEEISVYLNRGLNCKEVNLEIIPDDGHKSAAVAEDEISYGFEDDDPPVMEKNLRIVCSRRLLRGFRNNARDVFPPLFIITSN